MMLFEHTFVELNGGVGRCFRVCTHTKKRMVQILMPAPVEAHTFDDEHDGSISDAYATNEAAINPTAKTNGAHGPTMKDKVSNSCLGIRFEHRSDQS
jgi:hypothetical protein